MGAQLQGTVETLFTSLVGGGGLAKHYSHFGMVGVVWCLGKIPGTVRDFFVCFF